MTQLAIKGHATRGKEVIQILEMLGGENIHNYGGERDIWYVVTYNTIEMTTYLFEEKGFTLEKFLEKYPYNVGDKVRIPEYESEVRIDAMKWDGFDIQYSVFTDKTEWYYVRELNEYNEPHKEETTEEKKINQMSIANCDLDEVEIVLGDKFELVNREGKYYAVKKQPKYPKTYEHCCKIESGIAPSRHLQYDTTPWYQFEEDLRDSLENLRKLIICRNAYWRIAGEQMGLGKPWKPNSIEMNHAIVCRDDGSFLLHRRTRGILIFPTAEMRDAFYENFKDLIESCKDLL